MAEELAGGLLAERVTEEFMLVTTDADPAAGAEVLVSVPGRARWEVLSVVVQLVVDATAITRNVLLVADDQTTTFMRATAAADQAASTTNNYSWFRGAVSARSSVAPVEVEAPLPTMMLLPGFRLRTITANLQAADNYGRPALLVRELAERGPVSALGYELEQQLERLRALTDLLPAGVM